MIGVAAVVVIGVRALVWMSKKQTSELGDTIAMLMARNDSLVAAVSGREAGLDSAARDIKRRSDAIANTVRSGGAVPQAQLDELEKKRRGVMSAAGVGWTGIRGTNNPAVAFVAVQAANDTSYGGTAFGILSSGLLVTNKHVVERDGKRVKQVGVAFAGTSAFLEARVVGVVDDADLAFLQVVNPGKYPVVAGVADHSSASVGDPIGVIGFPLSTSLAMDTASGKTIYSTTMTSGMLSKVISNELQLDAFAAEGSSGSPVFDARGFVIGIVYSGNTESGGRVVYAVPSAKLIAKLPAEAKGIVRQ
jgi:S1-C subfamily serine protease